MDSFLPARFSMSPFFVRHVAKPRRMKHIEGLNGAPICAVNDEGFMPIKGGYENTFPPNNHVDLVLKSNENFKQNFKKKEKALGPSGQFQTYGLIDDTQRWKAELDKLATSVGLITQDDIEKAKLKKDKKKLNDTPSRSQTGFRSSSPDKKPSSSLGKNARLNEPLNTGRKTSRGTPASRAMSVATGRPNYLVDDRDREVWMLQVLCQVLQTDNLSDVQSWLVSSDPSAKERVKQLLDHAMKGLEESGRIEPVEGGVNQTPLHTAKKQTGGTAMSKIVEENNNNIKLDDLQSTIQRISLQAAQAPSRNDISRASANVRPSGADSVDILKLEEDAERRPLETPSGQQNFKRSQSSVLNRSGSRNLNDSHMNQRKSQNEYESPISPVFNVNVYPSKSSNQKEKSQSELRQNAVFKVEAPNKDMKIEEVKFTMVVKDEKSNKFQSIEGNWKPDESVIQ